MKKIFSILLILATIILLCSCTKKKEQVIAANNSTYVYYLSSSETELFPVAIDLEGLDTEEKVAKLAEAIFNIPSDKEVKLPVTDTVEFDGYQIENNVVYLFFDTSYQMMKAGRRTLSNAALAKTFTQIEGIEYVSITAGGQTLTDDAGNTVGLLAAGDFIESVSDVNSYISSEITLYFADATGASLALERREVVYNMNTPLEKVVLDNLIKGTSAAGHIATIPQGTKLISVSVNEGTCYVNFSDAFLTPIIECTDYVTIYSIVNSLSELPNVNRVQIMVNSSQDVNFRDNIPLNTTFERNLDYLPKN